MSLAPSKLTRQGVRARPSDKVTIKPGRIGHTINPGCIGYLRVAKMTYGDYYTALIVADD